MSYPYNIIRNGYSVPLTQIYSGYNSSGITPGYVGMGTISTSSVDYNKQTPIEYYYNGSSVFRVIFVHHILHQQLILYTVEQFRVVVPEFHLFYSEGVGVIKGMIILTRFRE